MDRGDDGEREVSSRGQSYPMDGRGHLGLGDAGLDHAYGRDVHIHGNIDGLLDLGDLFGPLDGPHFDDGTDELNRGFGGGLAGRDPKPIHELEHVLRPVGRQEMDRALFRPGVRQKRLQSSDGSRPHDARLRGPLPDRRLRPHPDEVLDGQVIAVNRVRPFVEVDDPGQPGEIESEEVQERTVLPEVIGVVRVVHRALLVPKKEGEPRLDLRAQAVPSGDVNIAIEHGGSFAQDKKLS
jgi:hypothetical protein